MIKTHFFHHVDLCQFANAHVARGVFQRDHDVFKMKVQVVIPEHEKKVGAVQDFFLSPDQVM